MTTESLNTRTKYAIFTIDAEDFGDTGCIKQSGADMSGHRMLDGLDTYIALLEKHGAKATVFTVCNTAHAVADKLKSYASRGHEIALHGLEHINPAELSDEEFSRSVSEAKREIEDELVNAVRDDLRLELRCRNRVDPPLNRQSETVSFSNLVNLHNAPNYIKF